MTKMNDQEWLDTLSGNIVSSAMKTSDQNEDQYTSVLMLRKAIQNHSPNPMFSRSNGIDHELIRLHEKLKTEGLYEPSVLNSLKERVIHFVKRIQLFIGMCLGVLIAATLPMQVATRGDLQKIKLSLPLFELSKTEANVNQIERIVPSPLAQSEAIVASAIAAGLTVKIYGKSDDIYMVISGFEKDNDKNLAINSILELSNHTEGEVTLHLKKK